MERRRSEDSEDEFDFMDKQAPNQRSDKKLMPAVYRPLSTIMEKSSEALAASMIEPTRCLLANDNTFLLMAFKETLKSHFEQVDGVENGKQAVDMVI